MIETKVVIENFELETDMFAEGSSVRFTQFSDLHAGSLLPRKLWLQAVHRSIECRPDFFTITGDLISRDARFPEKLESGIRRLCAFAPVFACLGNHDIRHGGDRIEDLLRDWGVTVLRDANTLFISHSGARIRIIGLRDVITEKIDLDKALDGAGDGEFRLMMAHNPDSMKELKRYAERNGRPPADLVISGHTHGGQICLPIIGPLGRTSKMRYLAGYYEQNGIRMYVNRGIGTVTSPFRINSAPEVTLYTIRGCAPKIDIPSRFDAKTVGR